MKIKCVQHSRDGTIFRMRSEDAQLLVSSGRFVFISKFQARDAAVSPHRSVLARIGMFAAAALAVIALLVLSTSARAADKPVPKQSYKVCLSKDQAAQVYKGKRLKYREVQGERCWYAGATLPKHAFMNNPGSEKTSRLSVRVKAQAARRNGPPERQHNTLGVTAGETAPFPRATGVAVTPARLPNQEQQRVQAVPSGSIPDVGASPNRTSFTATLEDDAVLALAGRPESWFTFDAYWDRMTGWQR